MQSSFQPISAGNPNAGDVANATVSLAIEQAALAFKNCSPDDPPSMAALHTAFESFRSAAADLAVAPAIQLFLPGADAAIQAIEKIVLRETDDVEAAMRCLASSVNELQSLLNKSDSSAQAPLMPEETDDRTGAAGEIALLGEADVPLLVEFVNEAGGHIEAAETALLLLEDDQSNSDAINSVFRSFHTLKGVAGFMNLVEIGSLAHAAENVLDLARNAKLAFTSTIADVILQSVDAMRKLIDLLKPVIDANGGAPAPLKGLQSLLLRLHTCVEGDPAGVPTPRAPQAAAGIVLPQESEQEQLRPQDQPQAAGPSTIKVSTERLDALINMVGELVIAQAMVGQDIAPLAAQDRRVSRNLAHLAKITRELQDHSMAMRMVPIQGVFQKMARLVRDLARKAGKEIELVVFGGETELDRNVVEAISDPLVHMVRNAADHGIELPGDREKAQKPLLGRIALKAYHQAGNIVIEITDDGKGLNKQRILRKAIDNGMVREGQDLSEQDIFQLIFSAGLSTAEKVTDVSGRGVGMDVVKRNVESLRGRIDIVSTEGKGSTFTIRLPLTLAVIDGLVVKVGRERYIIPITSIEQSLRPRTEQISTIQNRAEMCMVRDRLVPVIRLHRLFNIPPIHNALTDGLLVIVHNGATRCCLLVDELLGQQQVVIKSLGTSLGELKGIAGGAILGDGNVSLILDIPSLLAAALVD